MELISVIVPIYNVEKYIDKCIRSIVGQTYKNLEIILVDDGSPDCCPAICDEWAKKDARIKVIHKQNGGLSDARNAGLKIVTGEYIAFVDSDDFVAIDYIECLYTNIKKNDAQISACDIEIIEDDGETSIENNNIPYKTRVCTPDEAIDDILHGVGFRAVAWNKLYKADLLKNEFYLKGKYHEDEFFTYRILAKAKKLVYIEKKLYFYIQRQGSIMNTISEKHLDVLDAFIQRLEFIKCKFPQFYSYEKFMICIACVNFYRQLDNKKLNSKKLKKKIKSCRGAFKIKLSELNNVSFNKKVYAVFSKYGISVFCKILNFREKRK